MIVPAEVVERGDQMTDDEVIAAFVAHGRTEAYARVWLDSRRGDLDELVDRFGPLS